MSVIATPLQPVRPLRRELVWLSAAVCLVGVAAFLSRVATTVSGNVGGDFGIYLEAAARLRTGLPIYQSHIDISRAGWPYVYSPLLAQALMPLAGSALAWPIWIVLSLACWAGCLGTLVFELRSRLWHQIPREWRPVVLAAFVMWPSVLLDLWLGQAQLPLLALLTGAWWFLRRDHRTAAGVLLGVAIAMKPLPLAALAVLFGARQFRVTLVACAVAGLLTVISFSFAGWDQAYVYLFQTAPEFDRFWATNPNNRSLAMTLQLLLGTQLPEWTNYAFAVLLVGAATAVAWLTRLSSRRALAIGVTVFLLATPILEMYYMLLAYIPLAQSFSDGRSRQRGLLVGVYGIILAASYLLPAPEDPSPVLALKSGLPALALLVLLAVQLTQAARGRDD